MEILHSVWQISILALLAGALIGILAYRLFTPSGKEVDKIQAELDAAREELTGYKSSVQQHFDRTSELVNDLTQDYVKVYQHLAQGAQSLGDIQGFNNLLEQSPGKVSIEVDDESAAPVEKVDEAVIEAAAVPAGVDESPDEHAAPFPEVASAKKEPVEAPAGSADLDDAKSDAAPDSADAASETTAASQSADAARAEAPDDSVKEEAANDEGKTEAAKDAKTGTGAPSA